ncbi:ankyrin repeat domain-containing protein 63-like [Triticum dicoccoides]|uniref:ankyrin repeat domain-containing protein 63-like n=1 Tax=Triticum dicoccoides TaxID=85692 RepID=UPI00188FFD80|nr:ankyrin repeat domain-containing protein 63-like [Triticum dicoccoides]
MEGVFVSPHHPARSPHPTRRRRRLEGGGHGHGRAALARARGRVAGRRPGRRARRSGRDRGAAQRGLEGAEAVARAAARPGGRARGGEAVARGTARPGGRARGAEAVSWGAAAWRTSPRRVAVGGRPRGRRGRRTPLRSRQTASPRHGGSIQRLGCRPGGPEDNCASRFRYWRATTKAVPHRGNKGIHGHSALQEAPILRAAAVAGTTTPTNSRASDAVGGIVAQMESLRRGRARAGIHGRSPGLCVA